MHLSTEPFLALDSALQQGTILCFMRNVVHCPPQQESDYENNIHA